MRSAYPIILPFTLLSLYTTATSAQFVDVANPVLANAGAGNSVSWGDFDADDDPDLVLLGQDGNALLRNAGAETFLDFTPPDLSAVSPARTGSWGDYDNDGDLDLAVSATPFGRGGLVGSRLLRNDGGAFFSDVTLSALGNTPASLSLAWVDADGDGDLDLFLALAGPNALYRNDGNDTFVDATPAAFAADAEFAMTGKWSDYDADGDADLYVVNIAGPNRLFRNDGNLVFADVATGAVADQGVGFGAAWADVDGDADMDLYLVNDDQPNRLLRNDDGTLVDATTPPLDDAGPGASPVFGDYDNDGDLDLYLPNDSFGATRLFRNDGTSGFVGVPGDLPRHARGGGGSSCAAWADFDGDGDLDLYEVFSSSANRLLRNEQIGTGRAGDEEDASIQLQLSGTTSNRAGIGAQVRTQLRMDGDPVVTREVSGGGGSQNELRVHVGIADRGRTGLVEIAWPSGVRQTFSGVPPLHEIDAVEGTDPWSVVTGAHEGSGIDAGVSFADFDGDGDPDLFIGSDDPSAAPRFLQNDRGVFSAIDPGPVALEPGTESGVFADIDNDGDLDMLAMRETHATLLRNDAGTWIDPLGSPLVILEEPESAAFADYDRDGDLDFFVGSPDDNVHHLFRNDAGGFVDVTTGDLASGESPRGVTWADYDDDGDPDLALSGQGYGTPIGLYRNDGDDVFVKDVDAFVDDRPAPTGQRGFSDVPSLAWGDYDNDGDLDLFLSGESSLSGLYRNDDALFVEIDDDLLFRGREGYGASWLDYDADGDLDLYFPDDDEDPSRLLRNDAGTFVIDIVGPLGEIASARTTAFADIDADGDLDVLLSRRDEPARLFRNERQGDAKWLAVDLRGSESNAFGIGARVRVVSALGPQTREVAAGSGHASQNATTAFFGLGNDALVDSVVVRWPSGTVQVLTDVAVSQRITIEEPPAPWVEATPVGVAGNTTRRSVAWGDFDGDQDPDLFLPTEAGSTNKLFRNDEGALVDVTTGVLAGTDDGTGAAWGDVDNDGDLDLFTGTGISGTAQLLRNDDGTFVDLTTPELALAGVRTQSVTWVDADSDGDLDLYATSLTGSNVYFRNEGGSVLVDATPSVLEGDGQNNGAAWGDMDGDGDPDLVLGSYPGGGGTVHFYRNDAGTFVDLSGDVIPATAERSSAAARGGPSGCQTIALADYDNDGDLDILGSHFDTPSPGTLLLRNELPSPFVDVTPPEFAEVEWARTAVWLDAENDGDLDLVLCDFLERLRLFRNDGGGVLSNATPQAFRSADDRTMAAAVADVDSDGDLDLYVATFDDEDRLYRNDASSDFHWFGVRLVGVQSNRFGVGARVRIVTGGLSQMREIQGGQSYGQNGHAARFGVGAATSIDSLVIRWPSGTVQSFANLSGVDVELIITEDQTTPTDAEPPGDGVQTAPLATRLMGNRPNPFNPLTTLTFSLASRGHATLRVFDVDGRLVRELVNDAMAPGSHSRVWRGLDGHGRPVGSGTYFYRLESLGVRETRRMQLIR